ncbi:GNAT family N-acetyltransferase [Clostridium hydrogenum]|uniref:GNAT family N-acetyltransferase n=1 Tax=Clostridium hydrogenum TaxID=2855764 RepID=UPI001F244F63|nr:GNAT family N-acetyltransferase [Clostridium hydrogenum]
MMLFCKRGKLSIRGLENDDKKLIVKWLSDNRVLQYYEGRDNPFDEQMVKEKFYDGDSDVTRCIIEYYNIPIGYIQFYLIDEEERSEYGYADFGGNVFGTDQFIGEPQYFGQGIGTELMKAMIDFLIEEKDAQKIVLDPQVLNKRAIKCYEKSGFVKVKKLLKHEVHEGKLRDCWLMEHDKNPKGDK